MCHALPAPQGSSAGRLQPGGCGEGAARGGHQGPAHEAELVVLRAHTPTEAPQGVHPEFFFFLGGQARGGHQGCGWRRRWSFCRARNALQGRCAGRSNPTYRLQSGRGARGLSGTWPAQEVELVIGPAVAGVENVLAAASRAGGVRRVVMTSSVAAVVGDHCERGRGHVFTEADWNLTATETRLPYHRRRSLLRAPEQGAGVVAFVSAGDPILF